MVAHLPQLDHYVHHAQEVLVTQLVLIGIPIDEFIVKVFLAAGQLAFQHDLCFARQLGLYVLLESS